MDMYRATIVKRFMNIPSMLESHSMRELFRSTIVDQDGCFARHHIVRVGDGGGSAIEFYVTAYANSIFSAEIGHRFDDLRS